MKSNTRMMLLFVFCLTFISLYGQPVLTKDDLPAIGTISQMEVDTIGVNVSGLTTGGTGQTWDGTQNLNIAKAYEFKIQRPDETSYGSKFSDATYATLSYVEHVQLTAIALILEDPADTLLQPYRFEKINDDQVLGLGMELSVSILTGAFRFKNPAVIYSLPMEMNKNWTYNAQVDTTINFSGFNFLVSLIENASVTVDGAGTLNLNSGTFPCLRLRYNWSRRFYLNNQEITAWTNTRVIYRWIASGVGIILEVISKKGEQNNAFTTASQVTRMVSTNAQTAVECAQGCGRASNVPKGYCLNQNHPNPFNPSTRIAYDLPEAARVELAIFNLLGQPVALLENGVKGMGTHELTWTSRDSQGRMLPSGIYFYRLKAEPLSGGAPFIQTKKLILTD